MITRRKYLKRSQKPIKTRKRSKRFRSLRNEAFLEFVRDLPCVLNGREQRGAWDITARDVYPWPRQYWCKGRSHPHHVSGRKVQDVGSCCPLCPAHHRELHDTGRMSFALKYCIDLQALAVELGVRWQREKAA